MTRLVVDVGAHDGEDTQEYLRQGFRVLAIEADPLKAAALRSRFRPDISAGRLIVESIGVGDSAGILTFYRAEEQGRSSFDASFADSSQTVAIEVKPLADVIRPHGRPYYLKCDIEGFDFKALSTLTPDLTPDFISAEISDQPQLLDLFVRLGFRKFKLIAQPWQTSSEDIYPYEIGWRLLRKLSRTIPGFRSVVQTLPRRWRPKTEWDEDSLGSHVSGPWGDAADGPWLTEKQARIRIGRIVKYAPNGRAWVDLHAARGS